MALKDWPDAGFPGTAIDPTTLRPAVVDETACEQALSRTTDPADAVFVLLARGRTAEAAEAAAAARIKDPDSLRLQVLDADILGATHRTESAVERLRRLAAAVSGTPAEAEVRLHLGKALFSAGKYAAAAQSFNQALELTVAAGAGAAQIYSSTLALRRARDLADVAAS
jgi:Flp pilus assembly protein TadD